MSRYFRKLATLITASLAGDVNADAIETSDVPTTDNNPVKATALNEAVSIQLAQHRSHSSHGSHRSHRSSSGGSTPRRAAPPPPPPPPKEESPPARESDPLGQEPRDPSSYPPATDSADITKQLKDPEALKNLVMRIQISLQIEGKYDGTVDGVMGPETRAAILEFKKQRGIPGDTIFDKETLNALGVIGH